MAAAWQMNSYFGRGCDSGLSCDQPSAAVAYPGSDRNRGPPSFCEGKPFENQVTLYGTVSAGQPIQPQCFAATGDPVKFLVFEPAHDPMIQVPAGHVPVVASALRGRSDELN